MNANRFIYLQFIRKILLELPGTREGICFGDPAFYINKKLLSVLKKDGETLLLHTLNKQVLINNNPDIFFTTDHLRTYPGVLIRLSKIDPGVLEPLIIDAWRSKASKTLLKQYQGPTG